MPTDSVPRQSLIGDLSQPGELPPSTSRSPRTSHASSSLSHQSLLLISHRLQPRDYAIAHLLDEHTCLTTTQICDLLFTSTVTCQHRLHRLRHLGFLDRFIRNRPGTPRPLCWVAGPLAVRYVALARGDNPPSVKAVRERQDRIFASPTLDHLLGVNEFFTRLLVHARHDPTSTLDRWWSERTTAAAYGRRIHPDAHGVWTDAAGTTGFFLEYDTGTEPLGRLIAKLSSHRRLRADGGPTYPVLFALPNRAREQNLHRKLSDGLDPSIVVATTSPEAGTDPSGPVWRLFGNGRQRHTLAGLQSSHGQPGPLNPGPPEPGEDPLRSLRTV